MRLTKRILLTLMEAVFLLLLSILTITLAVFLKSVANVPHEYGFFFGSAFSLYGLFVIQGATRNWKAEYDAARWMERRSELTLHVNRGRYVRLVQRSLLWLPSACASLVLFFFPVVTHLVHPFSHYVKHYRIPVPWTWTVLSPPFAPEEYSYTDALVSTSRSGRFGLTPFWDKDPSFSVVRFGSVGPNGAFGFNSVLSEARRKDATEVSRRELHLGVLTLTCWQYVTTEKMRFWHALPKTYWQIDCETPQASNPDLYAHFWGRQQDIPAFYDVLQNITRTH